MSTIQTPILIVVGASGRIGREVARLGVGYGAEVYGITRHGAPDLDEPWVHGVRWLARDAAVAEAFRDLPPGALVIAASIAPPWQALERFDRVVMVIPPSAVVPSTVGGAVLAQPDEVDDSPIDWDAPELPEDAIRVEMLGMALLRAALDEDIPSVLDHDQLRELGDAVMLQRIPTSARDFP